MDNRNLNARLRSETVFHDKKFAGGQSKNDYYAMGFTEVIFLNMIKKLGDIEGKSVLECGCGEGWLTELLVRKGAEVWSFDISGEAVAIARRRVESRGLGHKAHIDQMAAEKLKYEPDKFDLIVGMAILHHVDLSASVREMKRVLKDGGKAVFMEPLGHNPLLNLYRRMTPSLRSKDETPLRFEDFAGFRTSFSVFEHEEFYLTAMLALCWYLVGAGKLMRKSRDLLVHLDSALLKCFPFLRKYCWYSVMEFTK